MNISSNFGGSNSSGSDPRVGQVIEEFTDRLNQGEEPTVEEYCQRFPDIADELRESLELILICRQPIKDEDTNSSLIGKKLGDFSIVQEIGKGGMGVVYLANQVSFRNRPVAVKVLPEASRVDPRRVQRFINEANTMASLEHEHIVQVISVGQQEDIHYFAMHYIQGNSLDKVILQLRILASRAATVDSPSTTLVAPNTSQAAKQGLVSNLPNSSQNPTSFTWDRLSSNRSSVIENLTKDGNLQSEKFFQSVARLGLEAAKGLEYTHQNIVIHRDIKPHNLILDNKGKLWITDFGLAHMNGDPSFTEAGELLGTLRYMSPEQALANRVTVDCRTDIYSLGATLYELLTLEPVFDGQDRKEILTKIAFEDPKPPREINRKIPYDLETIVLKALAKNPAHRYCTAKEMAEDFQHFLNGEPIKARREGVIRWIGRKIRRHASSITVAVSLLLSFLLLGNYLFSSSPEEKEHRKQLIALNTSENRLKRKEKLTIIGEGTTGKPGYYKLLTEEKPSKIMVAEDGEFSFQNLKYGLLELLPDPQWEHYRFSAEVRHDHQANLNSIVGIYFCHSILSDGDTPFHYFCYVAFNDLVDVGLNNGMNKVNLQAFRLQPAGLNFEKSSVTNINKDHWFIPNKASGMLGPWRKLDVEVSNKQITIFFDGTKISTTPRKQLDNEGAYLAAPKMAKNAANSNLLMPRGGLGLYASLGIGSFRNVTVEHLD